MDRARCTYELAHHMDRIVGPRNSQITKLSTSWIFGRVVQKLMMNRIDVLVKLDRCIDKASSNNHIRGVLLRQYPLEEKATSMLEI